MLINIVVACSKDPYGDSHENFVGIGYDNRIPWHSPEDMESFKKITENTILLMGRKTHESIGRILTDRENFIVGNQFSKKIPGAFYFRSIEDAVETAKDLDKNISVIGGSEIYRYMLKNYTISKVYLTEINRVYTVNKFFHIDFKYFKISRQEKLSDLANLVVYNRKNSEEEAYLELIRKAIGGSERVDRTSVGTFAVFGEKLTFDLSKGFPLLTTKKIPWKMVLKELLWFLSGSTDNQVLNEQNVHIWDGNTTREFLDSRGLNNLPEGDLGAMYGFQFRHSGAQYKDCKTDYTGQGFDQIKNAIDLIKNDPGSRRIIITSYNPADREKMCLYPCHGLVIQFFVRENMLDCQMYQRSADIGLGLPFNIASYAFLVHMFAHVTGLSPGVLNIITGDTHVYSNHVEPLKRQLERTPYAFPKLKINREVKDIFDFCTDDFDIIDYECYPGIKMQMAV